MRPARISFPRRLVAPLAAVAALLVAGCGSLSVPFLPRLPSGGDDVDVIEIRRLGFCASAGDAAAVTLLADEAALRDWQTARGIDLITAAPAGLLPPGPFAVVEHGTRASTGYGVLVSRRAYQEGRSLRITASFLSPKPGDAAGYALSSPCVLVKLPPGNYDQLGLVDPAGTLRARYLPPVKPAPAPAP